MVFLDRTYSVLIVSASEKFIAVTMSLLPGSDFFPVSVAGSVSDARRRLLESSYDIVIINAPLPDDFGLQLAMDACGRSEAGVLLLVRRELYDETYYNSLSAGVVTLSKPINAQTMSQALRILCATRERLRRMEEKQVSVEKKIEEIRVVNRAKWLLIECLHMSEEDAHRYISRQAMDKRVSKREAAEDIIRTYQ